MKRQLLAFFIFIAISITTYAQNSVGGLLEGQPAEVGMSDERLTLLDNHIQKYIREGSMPGGVILNSSKRKGRLL